MINGGINLVQGDVVEIVGMLCLENGTIRRINQTNDGQLYVFCNCHEGRHSLEHLQSQMIHEAVTFTKI